MSSLFRFGGREAPLRELGSPLEPGYLLPGDGPLEIELGFGKGRYLLERAAAHPERRFLGIEVATTYYRLVAERAARRGLGNVALVRGEALYLLAAVFPCAFASCVHVYFPDPWPKSRHHKRRLFDPHTVDLVLGLLAPGGQLDFATDFLDYGEWVSEILTSFPRLHVERLSAWPDGARTHYEAKYMAQGRPILRLRARSVSGTPAGDLHPAGLCGILVAARPSCTS